MPLMASRINVVDHYAPLLVRKTAGENFSRGKYQFESKYLIAREVQFLRELSPSPYFPTVIDQDEKSFTMNYGGERVTKSTLPSDWKHQFEQILKALETKGIIHRDIKAQNLLVLDGHLMLIDFGWAVYTHEKPYTCPQDLCEDVPKELIYNNRKALYTILEKL